MLTWHKLDYFEGYYYKLWIWSTHGKCKFLSFEDYLMYGKLAEQQLHSQCSHSCCLSPVLLIPTWTSLPSSWLTMSTRTWPTLGPRQTRGSSRSASTGCLTSSLQSEWEGYPWPCDNTWKQTTAGCIFYTHIFYGFFMLDFIIYSTIVLNRVWFSLLPVGTLSIHKLWLFGALRY